MSSPGAGTVGVLALQGSFELHLRTLESLGARPVKVRRPSDLAGLDALIIPGGESTVMTGIGRENGLFDAIRSAALERLPVFGTCAGAILLGEGDDYPERLGVVPVTVERNAYGRQRESFEKDIVLEPVGGPFRCIFIRAPKIHLPRKHRALGLEVLGRDGDDPVLVRHGRHLLSTFHPELTGDTRIHRYFLDELVGEPVGETMVR